MIYTEEEMLRPPEEIRPVVTQDDQPRFLKLAKILAKNRKRLNYSKTITYLLDLYEQGQEAQQIERAKKLAQAFTGFMDRIKVISPAMHKVIKTELAYTGIKRKFP